MNRRKARGKTRKIMVASIDFYRPAAIDQLEILAQKAGVLFYRASASNPVAAAQEIVKKSQQELCDILILDTAGRLHVDQAMLDELKQVDMRIKPKYKILVIDAMTGQESLKVAQSFENQVGFMGAILTKMDSDTRGGAAFAFRYALKKPILYIATGEKLPDLELFRPERMASRIMGQGDLQTLFEKAQEKINVSEQEAMSKSFEQGRFSLEDFAQQLQMMGKIGSLSSVMKYMPGMGHSKFQMRCLKKVKLNSRSLRQLFLR